MNNNMNMSGISPMSRYRTNVNVNDSKDNNSNNNNNCRNKNRRDNGNDEIIDRHPGERTNNDRTTLLTPPTSTTHSRSRSKSNSNSKLRTKSRSKSKTRTATTTTPTSNFKSSLSPTDLLNNKATSRGGSPRGVKTPGVGTGTGTGVGTGGKRSPRGSNPLSLSNSQSLHHLLRSQVQSVVAR